MILGGFDLQIRTVCSDSVNVSGLARLMHDVCGHYLLSSTQTVDMMNEKKAEFQRMDCKVTCVLVRACLRVHGGMEGCQ